MSHTREDKKRVWHLRVIISYLKNNGHRIAHHAHSRTETPLASRDDIKSVLPLINGEAADILTLDSDSKKTFVKVIQSDELIAHFLDDLTFTESISTLNKSGTEGIHYVFVTSGIFTPSFLTPNYLELYPHINKLTFLETRVDPSIHNISNPTIYLRKAIGQIRDLETIFQENPSDLCECGGQFSQGKYNIRYWNKKHQLDYSVCDNCGIQKEDAENANSVMNFLMGLSAE
ncbi:MAG: hypothetical protein ACXACK_18780 [Candidatus Hodarchaeales archaeon]